MTASISPASIACCSGPPLVSRDSTFYPQRQQHLGLVAEVADQVRGRQRRQLGEAGCDENAVGHRAPRMFQDVDHFQLVAVLQVFPADSQAVIDYLPRTVLCTRD